MQMYIEVERKRQSIDVENNPQIGRGPTQQQQLLDKETIRVQAEVDFHANQIAERQEAFDVAEGLMKDIHGIGQQLQTQTRQQGEDLVRTDQKMDQVVQNADDAHKEIKQA